MVKNPESGSQTSSAPTDKQVGTGATRSGAAGENNDRPPVRMLRRVLAVAGAIVTIGGAVTLISQTTHWLDNLTHAHAGKPVSEIERSPILGMSFYQNAQMDPMSYSDPGGTGQNLEINVSMKPEPFELWFPVLGTESSVEVCASNNSAILNSVRQTGKSGVITCLSPGTGAADYAYASGTLFESSGPQDPIHTQIDGSRVQSASGGDQRYYISTLTANNRSTSLTNRRSKLYLVIYFNDNYGRTFEPNNLERFVLNFS